MNKIYLGSDTDLEWGKEQKLTRNSTGLVTKDATCTVELYDDQEVGGPTQLTPTITLSAVVGSDGLYRGTIADNHTGLLIGMSVRLEWTADDGAGLKLFKVTIAQVVRAK